MNAYLQNGKDDITMNAPILTHKGEETMNATLPHRKEKVSFVQRCLSLAALGAAALAMTVAAPRPAAAQNIIADSATDFLSTHAQGAASGWEYGWYNPAWTTANFAEFNRWFATSQTWKLVNSSGYVTPNLFMAAYASSPIPGTDAIRRWKSTYTGWVTVRGSVQRLAGGSGANNIRSLINYGGTNLWYWDQTIWDYNFHDFALMLPVSANIALDLVQRDTGGGTSADKEYANFLTTVETTPVAKIYVPKSMKAGHSYVGFVELPGAVTGISGNLYYILSSNKSGVTYNYWDGLSVGAQRAKFQINIPGGMSGSITVIATITAPHASRALRLTPSVTSNITP